MIAHYFSIVAFLIQLTRKDQRFSWGVEVDNAFQSLKVFFYNYPLLIHVDPCKHFVLETDASNFVVNIILSQLEEDNLLHPIGFYSRKFSHVEINYEIHNE